MGTRRHGQEGALAPSGNVVKCFVHCITLSRRIIYALFSQPVVGFWRLRPHTLTGAPSLGPRWGTFIPKPLICPPLEKNPAGALLSPFVLILPSSVTKHAALHDERCGSFDNTILP